MDFAIIVVPNDEIQKRRKSVANYSFNWMTILRSNATSEVEFMMDLMKLVQGWVFMKKSMCPVERKVVANQSGKVANKKIRQRR
jgi:hypothetical protein